VGCKACSMPNASQPILIAATVFLSFVAVAPGAPLSPLILNTNNNHEYLMLKNAVWTESEAEAKGMGGTLATVRDQAEQDWIFNTFGGYNGGQHLLWIGLNDTNVVFDFTWVSGEPFSYSNWASGEPNNAGGVERYVAMYYPNFNQPGKWNDWTNRLHDPGGFPFNGVVEVIPAFPFTLTPLMLDLNNQHYYLLLTNADWTESEALAESVGGQLATVRNQAEQDWIFNTFGSYGGQQRLLWIGLDDTNTVFDFTWVSGEPLTFTNWATGEPNNSGGVERYVAMYYPNFNQPGAWNDWSDRTADPIGIPFNGVVEVVPRLGFRPQQGGGLELSWPLAMQGAVLEGTTNLSLPFAPLAFPVVTNAVSGTLSVAVPVSVPQMYFRLQR
jgi:Lectin C-type domain